MARVLFAATDHDLPTSISFWLIKHVIGYAREKHVVAVVSGSDDVRSIVEKMFAFFKPDVFIAEGHGDYSRLGGWRNQVVIDESNAGVLRGCIAWVLSCRTARDLGKAAVEKGCVSYVGFSEDFVFTMNGWNDPLTDEYGKWFFRPVYESMRVILEGGSVEEAYRRGVEGFDDGLKHWSRLPGKDASLMMIMMAHDKRCFKMIGSGEARVEPSYSSEPLVYKLIRYAGLIVPPASLVFPVFIRMLIEKCNSKS